MRLSRMRGRRMLGRGMRRRRVRRALRRRLRLVLATPRQRRNGQAHQHYHPLLQYLFTFQSAIHYRLLDLHIFFVKLFANP
jgi:hypothetical protein